MSGGSPGSPGPGGKHSSGFCPRCHRQVAGGVNHDTGQIWLRRHKATPGALSWCGEDGTFTYAMTDQDLALAYLRGKPVPGAPDPHPGYLDFVRKTVLGTMTPREWLESVNPEAGHPETATSLASPETVSTTGCPACGSDDYDTEPGPDGMPDYDHGQKTCLECGEEWV